MSAKNKTELRRLTQAVKDLTARVAKLEAAAVTRATPSAPPPPAAATLTRPPTPVAAPNPMPGLPPVVRVNVPAEPAKP